MYSFQPKIVNKQLIFILLIVLNVTLYTISRMENALQMNYTLIIVRIMIQLQHVQNVIQDLCYLQTKKIVSMKMNLDIQHY